MFSLELDNRAQTHNVRVYAVHPGSIGGTELGRDAPLELFQQMGFCDPDGNILPEVAASLKTIPQGAATSLWCATNPILNDIGGVYCEDVEVAEVASGTAFSSGVSLYSLDENYAQQLWRWSEEMIGSSFDVNV